MSLSSPPELVSLLQKNDKSAKKQVFEAYYSKLAAISQRYAKNQEQAEQLINEGLNACLIKLQHHPAVTDLELFIEKEFIAAGVAFIKNIRSEYYVASTVYASDPAPKNYDLFANNELIDFNQVENETLVKALQQLVPSQRLIFNLHVIEGYSLAEAAALVESSEQTVKSNLEKARFNLQKNIENCLKSLKV
ncbi:MAG: sigma-70 family RNA polymerase sigma factor [Bacteroidota bacterium]